MSKLSDKIKKARESKVTVNGKSFTVRRPSNLEMLELQRDKVKERDILERFVVGWDGFLESDLFAGGNPEPVPFEADVWNEWIVDNPQFWADLVGAVVESYREHEKRQAETLKN